MCLIQAAVSPDHAPWLKLARRRRGGLLGGRPLLAVLVRAPGPFLEGRLTWFPDPDPDVDVLPGLRRVRPAMTSCSAVSSARRSPRWSCIGRTRAVKGGAGSELLALFRNSQVLPD